MRRPLSLCVGQNYQQLLVWQRSIDVVTSIYKITRRFPNEELYSLTKQIRRAAVSIPSNIAEGQSRASTGEFRHFLGIARGSLSEVQTQLHIAERLGYLQAEQWHGVSNDLDEIGKMINGLIKALPVSTR